MRPVRAGESDSRPDGLGGTPGEEEQQPDRGGLPAGPGQGDGRPDAHPPVRAEPRRQRVQVHEGRHREGDRPALLVGGADSIQVAVSDTGIGMSPEQVGRLFQAFTQVDASAGRKFGGTGLGLAISQKLSATMGGQITVQSELGKGSTFTMTIKAML